TPLFAANVLNALRQPREDGWITLARAHGTIRFPARIQLVLAANPCPCRSPKPVDCSCPPAAKRSYVNRLSGPLLDRIDLRVNLQPVGAMTLVAAPQEQQCSDEVLKRVLRAREAAAQRWAGRGFGVNAHAPGAILRSPPFRLPNRVTQPLADRVDRGILSARGYDRVLRVAWTIVDLDG